MTQEQNQNATGNLLAGRGAIILVGALIVIGLLSLCFFAYQIFVQTRDPRPVADNDPTPTPFVADENPAFVTTDFGSVQIGPSSAISLSLGVPTFVRVGSQDFTVQTQSPVGAGWTPTFAQESSAVWLQGTAINYVFFVSDTDANRALIEGLLPGDPLRIETKQANLEFVFDTRNIVTRSNADVFSQKVPGITLILVNAAEGDRLVVRGSYNTSESLQVVAPGGADSAELGQAIALDDLQFTVFGATHQVGRAEAPPGFDFYLVDYELQNVGTLPFNRETLRLVLRDDFGNQYAASPVAGQLGNNPPFSGAIDANGVRQATVGFQIPSGLTSPVLTVVALRTDTNEAVEVRLPFTPTGSTVQTARVSLAAADVSADGTAVTLSGQVSNDGERPLVVEEGNVSLIDQGTVHLILSTNPGFPWIISPGETIPYTVSFQRPLTSGQAIFTVLNQSFQLTGLR